MIDVDDFKSYNDKFGHTEGDKTLQIVGICLKDTLRGADVAARYGGEEFSVLLPQTTLAEAARIGERIRKRVESTQFSNRQVTISIGVASCFNNICTEQEIVKWADNALYEAKRHGRNNVQVYEHLNAEPMTGDAKLTDTKILQIEPLVFSENDFARIRLREKVDVEAIFLED